jgi:MFS family permease
VSDQALSTAARTAVLLAAICALLFDGLELGLMPVASLSVSQDLLGSSFTGTLGGEWFARFTAALMLGAAVGGILLGSLGDVIGRTRTLGVSVLLYSLFAGLGAFMRTQQQMLALRFVVGLGIGGVWPNAVSLASECWPAKSRALVAGCMGAALNAGILLLSQIVRTWQITPESWRWVFKLAAAPAALGILVLLFLPESPLWVASRNVSRSSANDKESASCLSLRPMRELFHPPLLRLTFIGSILGSIPMIGAWAASKWMIPWADKIGGVTDSGYKAVAQGWWAAGAVLGSFFGAQVAAKLGRRLSYALISLGTTALTLLMFLGSTPLQTSFLPIVFAQGFIATLYFGWLPLYLPELFPTRVRATGTGIAYNIGRFATAAGVFASGALFVALGGSYPRAGAICGLVYALGVIVIWVAPETTPESIG